MGVVWRARDEVLHRDVAVKEVVLPDGLTESERGELFQRALREARAAALLDHPGIITVHDVVTEDDRPWIVMELIDGRSLDGIAPASPEVVAAVGLVVLDALRAAHRRGILHRDVKPTNILLADDGRVVLTDFGIASLEGDPALTRTGVFVGSPGYVAPERLREEPAGPASDLWSLGATLYAAVEGRPPYDQHSPMAVLSAILTEDPPPPTRAGPLTPVLRDLLHKDPSARIPADQAFAALRQISGPAHPSPSAPRQSPPSHAPEQPPPWHDPARAWSPPPPQPWPPAAPLGTRSRTGLLVPAAVAVAMVVAAVVAIVVGRPSGHGESAAASPTPSPPASPSAEPARYVRPFDFCALLTPEQVRTLVPGAVKLPAGEAHSCGWGSMARHEGVSITARIVYDPASGTEREDPWTTTPAEARTAYGTQYSAARKPSGGIAWGWDELAVRRVGAKRTGARRVPGVGDDAYTTDTSSGGVTERSDVTFRDSNLFIEIWYASAGGERTAPRIRGERPAYGPLGRRVPAPAIMNRVLGGRYTLTRPLGRGGMGTVWHARDETLGREVAVKELSLPGGLSEDRRAALCARALREARVSSRLRHRSIIRVHDVIAEDDRPWIVMELLTGRPLDEAGPLPPRRVAEIGLALLDALGAAHEQGILHRDVKPGNVFLCDDGRVVLADFGIATLEGDASLTASGGLIGSPGYIAPERLKDLPSGPPSDLWSLGATLYAAVDGRPPFARRTPVGVLGAVLTEDPPPPRWAGALTPLILAMLAKDPAARPSADQAAAALRHVAQDPETPAGTAEQDPAAHPSPGQAAATGRTAAKDPAARQSADQAGAAYDQRPETVEEDSAAQPSTGQGAAPPPLAARDQALETSDRTAKDPAAPWQTARDRWQETGGMNAAVPPHGVHVLRSPHRTAARLARRRTAIMIAVPAVLAAVAVGVSAVFLLGGDGGGVPEPAPVGPEGRFAVAPQACSLIGARPAPPPVARADGCSWDAGRIDLQIERFAPAGRTTAPDLARAYYADKRRQTGITAHQDDAIHSSQSGVTDLPATGDEAFVYDATDGIGTGRTSTVWLRASNLVVKIVYAGESGVHEGVLAAARDVARRLTPAGTP